MRAVHLFLVTVVEARSAKIVHQQGPNSPTRVHPQPGRARHPLLPRSGQVQQLVKTLRALPATSPARRLASFDGQGLTKSFAENTITVEHQPGGVR